MLLNTSFEKINVFFFFYRRRLTLQLPLPDNMKSLLKKEREIKPCCRSPLSFLTRQCRPLTPICWIPFALLNSSGVSLHEKTHRTSIVQEICFQISSSMLIVSNNNPKRKKRNSLSFLVFEWKITSCVSAPSFHFIGLCAWFFWAFDFLVRAFQLVDWASQSARQPVEFSLSLWKEALECFYFFGLTTKRSISSN